MKGHDRSRAADLLGLRDRLSGGGLDELEAYGARIASMAFKRPAG